MTAWHRAPASRQDRDGGICCNLAEALDGLPFDPAAPRQHAGYAWARARRFPRARPALESDPASNTE